MQEIEIKFLLNDQEFKQKLSVDDKQLVELIANAKNVKLGYDNSLAKMKLSEVRAEQAKLKAELAEKIKLDVDMASISETKNKLSLIEESLDGIVKKEKEAGSASGNWSLNIMGINQGLDLMRKAWEALSVPIAKAGQFEQYQVSMKVMLGSTEAAQKRLQELITFAKETPFELPQVVEAANQLQAIGLYSEETLRNLGDLASASGKPMEQALSAFAKMATGQKGIAVDMFRDLLISVDDWTEATGKGVKATGELEASASEMLEALPRIIKEKNFAGMMEEQSKTFNGAVSNMQDGLGQLLTSVGDAMLPFAKDVVASMNQMISAVIPVESNFEKAQKSSADLKLRFDQLAYTIETLGQKTNKTENEQKIYQQALDDIQKEYPKYFSSMDIHTAKFGEITTAIDGAKKELDKYIDSMIAAAIAQDKMNEITELGKAKFEAEKTRIETQRLIQEKTASGEIDKEVPAYRQASQLSGSFFKVPTYRENYNIDLTQANTTIDEATKKIEKLKNEIKGLNSSVGTIAPTDGKITDDGGGEPPEPPKKIKDYYQETIQEIQKSAQEQIRIEQDKNLTIYELNLKKQEDEKKLIQASINLNKNANSDKLKNEYEIAQNNLDLTVKSLNDRIAEEEKFQNRKSQFLEKLQNENQKEIESVKLKQLSLDELNNQMLQAEIDKSIIEDEMRLTSDESKFNSLEKDRVIITEKIQLINKELEAKNLSLKRDKEIADEKKKTEKSLLKSQQEAIAQTMLQYAMQYDSQKSFSSQMLSMMRNTVKQDIMARAGAGAAAVIESVMGVLPWPISLFVAPAAGMAAAAIFDAFIPKFETGGYPEGKNAIVQVNENGQEFIMNAQATAKYSDVLEKMNAGVYQPTQRYYSSEIYTGGNDNSGFAMLADVIQAQTDRLEKVERYVRVSELSEGLNNYQNQQSRLGY